MTLRLHVFAGCKSRLSPRFRFQLFASVVNWLHSNSQSYSHDNVTRLESDNGPRKQHFA